MHTFEKPKCISLAVISILNIRSNDQITSLIAYHVPLVAID